MKEKILSVVYQKLCSEYEANFIPRKQFEQEFEEQSKLLLDELIPLTKKYYQLRDSDSIEKSSNVLKESPKEKIKFDLYNYSGGKITFDDRVYNEDPKIVVPLLDYLKYEIKKLISSTAEDSILRLLWAHIESNWFVPSVYREGRERYNVEDRIDIIKNSLDKFRSSYLDNIFLQIFDKTEIYLSDFSFDGFETYVVNVGTRNHSYPHSGWITNTFEVKNNGKLYKFKSSEKDAKEIVGLFSNIFILQKKYLIKLSISKNDAEQVTYVIGKDLEKLSVKNECEVFISKHHGNETIIFDSRKDALNFEKKVAESRDGRYTRRN